MKKDVSDWEICDDWTTGTREKKWLLSKEKEKWLFKEPKIEGEMYAEVVAYLLGTKIFNLEVPETHFAIFKGKKGVISKAFTIDNIQLIEAVDFFGPEFNESDLKMYTIEQSLEVAKSFDEEETFIAMCIFDYIIANQDRHCQNWGVLLNGKHSDQKMAPFYDNGSSLLNGYNEDKVNSMLSNTPEFEAFTNRAQSIFTVGQEEKPKANKLFSFLINYDRDIFKKSLARFNHCDCDIILNTIKKVPSDIISNERKTLIAKLIMYRVFRINEYLKEGE
ncbi:HipA domain-containing protein [Enterococcus rotai]|uniref:HipA domain-containing protein n=1 Tax=Enterococcus rotai TaxID=118060 RepID=UPI0032B59907